MSLFVPQFAYLFIPNYFAERILAKGDLLMDVIYDSRVMEQTKEVKKIIIVMMEELKIPIKFEIVGIFRLSFPEFVAICNTTYSLYTVLKQM